MTRRLPCLLLLTAASCGYEVGNLYDYHDVKVPVFENSSDRRTQEFDLTDAVVHEMAARGIRVNAKDAPFILKGRILDMRTPSVVDQRDTDQVVVGSLTMKVEIRLVNADGAELWKEIVAEAASFTAARGESFETARQKVFDKISRRVVTRLEKQW